MAAGVGGVLHQCLVGERGLKAGALPTVMALDGMTEAPARIADAAVSERSNLRIDDTP